MSTPKTPKELTDRLAEIATSARHHPEPGLALAALAQMLHDVAEKFEPLLVKYWPLLHSNPHIEAVNGMAEATAEALASTPKAANGSTFQA